MLSVARAVVSGWWQGPLLAAICFQFPLLQWLAMAILALVTLRGGLSSSVMTLLAMVLGSFGVMALGQSMLPLLGLLSALVLVAASEVLRVARRLEWAWVMAALTTMVGLLALRFIVPEALAQYQDVLARAVEIWMQSLPPAEVAQLKESFVAQPSFMEALIVQGMAWQLMISVGIGLTLARYWQSVLFNPGGFGHEFRSFRLEPSLAAVLLGIWLAAQAGGVIVSGLSQVLWLPFLIGGIGCFHWYASVRKLPGFSYVAFYVVVFFIHIVVVMFALVDSFFDVRKRLKN